LRLPNQSKDLEPNGLAAVIAMDEALKARLEQQKQPACSKRCSCVQGDIRTTPMVIRLAVDVDVVLWQFVCPVW
jgi:hypothetical protein